MIEASVCDSCDCWLAGRLWGRDIESTWTLIGMRPVLANWP